MRRLICAFVVRIRQKQVFSWGVSYTHVMIKLYISSLLPDGRNHEGCCLRMGVTQHCQPLCNYAIRDPAHLDRDYTECIMHGLMIAQCLSEGQGKQSFINWSECLNFNLINVRNKWAKFVTKPALPYVNSKNADQPAHLPVWAAPLLFAV